MKTRMLTLLAAVLAFAAPALAQSVGERTGISSVLGISPSTADFVTQAAIGDMFEIQSSELAIQRGDPTTKTFAQQMISAHRKTSEELKELVAGGQVKETIPTKLDDAHLKKLEELKSLQGKDFVQRYYSDQADAHEDAVSLFERYAVGGDNPALKDWAAKTLPDLRQHLGMAEKLDEAS